MRMFLARWLVGGSREAGAGTSCRKGFIWGSALVLTSLSSALWPQTTSLCLQGSLGKIVLMEQSQLATIRKIT